MADEIKLNDHPSQETQLYMIGRAINSLSNEIREQNEKIDSNTNSINQWAFLQKEQNSNVSNLVDKYNSLDRRMNAHDDWHGEKDQELIDRLHREELEAKYHEGVSVGVRKILGIEVNAFKWLIGGGLVTAGLTLGKIINILGWW